MDIDKNIGTAVNPKSPTLDDVVLAMKSLPDAPKFFMADYKIVFCANENLASNTVIISKDLAQRLGIWKG
jgi:hypothetical protein